MEDKPEEDKPERKRPNAKYPLTEKKTDGEKLVFYYSREERLARAPKSVQDLYREAPKKKFGFFRVLTATKPLTMLFVSIMIICAFIMVLSILNLSGSRYTLGGNSLSIRAVKFQDETIVVLVKTVPAGKEAYTGLVDIGVSPAAPEGSDPADYPVFTHRIFFSLRDEEEYRFSLPFAADELVMALQGEGDRNSARLRLRVE
jgi:hypothetical protein